MASSRIPPELIERSFGLVATVENKRVVLPLKAVECEFSVVAGMVEVLMTQVFRQENPKALDCDYLFPLPADASVYFCEANFNGRVIRAKVKERGEAVRLAEQKKAEGHRVALVESERENLFTLTLSNLQPDDLVLVTLKYIQPLHHLADMPSVEIPFCPGIRYIPGNPLIRSNRGKGIADDTDAVPDASRISPVRMDKEHLDASFIEIRGRLDGKFVDAGSIISPSHKFTSRLEGDAMFIELADKGEVPDRDFVLRWKETTPETLTARAWLQEVGCESYALMEIRAPKASGPIVPMDFYFLLDQSGSMDGVKWQKAALAVKTCVSNFIAGDRVMLTLFNNRFQDFAEQPLPPAGLLADANFQQLERFQPGGGTELARALKHVLELASVNSQGRKKKLILITDAQLGNESAILKIMKSAPDFPVHSFGIDNALNDSLLLLLARQQHGTFHSLNPADDVVKIISDLSRNIRHPVLDGLLLSTGWSPPVLFHPPIFAEQVVYLSAKGNKWLPPSIYAWHGDTAPVEIPMTCHLTDSSAPCLHWSKNRIQEFIAKGDHQAAIALSSQSNLICSLTAFIAWDEYENVAVASQKLAQPNQIMEFSEEIKFCITPAIQRNRPPRISISYLSGCGGASMDRDPDAPASAGASQPMIDATRMPCVPISDPKAVVQAIVEHAGKLFRRLTPPPFPNPIDRRSAFSSLYLQVSSRGRSQGLSRLWQQIEDWAFDDKAHMLKRSTSVAKLLWELLSKADRCWAAHHQLFKELMELDRKAGNSSGDSTRAMRVIGGPKRTEAELAQMIAAEFHEHLDSRLIADYVRVPGEIRQAIEAFAKQYCN